MRSKPLFALLSWTLALVFLVSCGNAAPAVEPTATPPPPPATLTPVPPPPTPEPVVALTFATPEEAITHYFAGLAEADPDKLLAACAVAEMAEGFDFALYTERLGLLMPMQSPAPADDPLYVAANKMQFSAEILGRAKIFAYSLLSEEEVTQGAPIQLEPDRIAAFEQAVAPPGLAAVELQTIGRPDPALMTSDLYLENAAKQAAAYGADELTERVALFSFGEESYFVGFTLLRYGQSWKISQQTSPLAGTSALGAPQQTTVEEFESLTSGE